MVVLGLVLKGRPWVYLQPALRGPSVVVHNMAREAILVSRIACGGSTLLVARGHDPSDIERARAGHRLDVAIGPGAAHTFGLLAAQGWERLPPHRRVTLSVRWSRQEMAWLPQIPKRLVVSVGYANAVMRLAPEGGAMDRPV